MGYMQVGVGAKSKITATTKEDLQLGSCGPTGYLVTTRASDIPLKAKINPGDRTSGRAAPAF